MAMHLRIVLLIVALGSVAGQLRSHGDHQSEGEDVSQTAKFEEFKSQFSRKYATQEEEEYRFGVFRERDGFIDEFNAKQAANGPLTDETMLLGHNEFSDMSLKEFTSKHLGFKKMDDSVNVPHKPSNTTSGGLTFWKDFDWADGTENPKKASMVTSIDQQGDCGSCYAFAGVGALESAIAIHTGSLVKLSRQEIVDCAGYACEGGNFNVVMDYVRKHGIATDADYPYTSGSSGQAESCRASSTTRHIQPWKYTMYSAPADESKWEDFIQNNVPVFVGFAVPKLPSGLVDPVFLQYSSGTYTGPCGDDVDHALMITGFWHPFYATNYWIIKNSWGESWGHAGYLWAKQGVNLRSLPGNPEPMYAGLS